MVVKIYATQYNIDHLEQMNQKEFKAWHKKHFNSSSKEQSEIWKELNKHFSKRDNQGAE